jgi:hypothetical protein
VQVSFAGEEVCQARTVKRQTPPRCLRCDEKGHTFYDRKILPSSPSILAAGTGGSIGATAHREKLTFRKRTILTNLTLRRLLRVLLNLQRMLAQLRAMLY